MNAIMKDKENKIVEFDEFESKLIEFKKKYDNVVYDLTDPEQDKLARSDKYSIGKIISSLDSKHKELKAHLKARTDLIDGRRKDIKDELLIVQRKIKGQIEAHEQAKEDLAEKLQCMVNEILEHGEFEHFSNPDSHVLNNRLKSIRCYVADDKYEDRKADATLALIETTKQLETMLEAALKSEKEERERADREEKIRKEATEKATRDTQIKANLEAARRECFN